MTKKIFLGCGIAFVAAIVLISSEHATDTSQFIGVCLLLLSMFVSLGTAVVAYKISARKQAQKKFTEENGERIPQSRSLPRAVEEAPLPEFVEPPTQSGAPAQTESNSGDGPWWLRLGIALAVMFGIWKVIGGVLSPVPHDPSGDLEIQNLESTWTMGPAQDGGTLFIPAVRFNLRNSSARDLKSVTLRATFTNGETIAGTPPEQYFRDLPAGLSNGPIDLRGNAGYGSDLALYDMRKTGARLWHYKLSCSADFGSTWADIKEGDVELPEPIRSFPQGVMDKN